MLSFAGAALLLGQWFISSSVCVLTMFTGTGNIRFPAFVTLAWALGALIFSWLYLHFVDKTLLGVVVIITIARTLGSMIHLIYGIYSFELDSIDIIVKSILKPLLISFFVCCIGFLFSLQMDSVSIPYLFLIGFIVTMAYSLLTWSIALTKSERYEVTLRIKRIYKGAV